MRFRPVPCAAEVHIGEGPSGTLIQGELMASRVALLSQYAGQVQTVYLDPPFNTGKTFTLRQRCGEAGWRHGKPIIELPAYSDRWPDQESLFSLLRESIEIAHTLLHPKGSLFMHIDSRLHAHARLMLDDVFGAKNFVNEIIWAYQSGGRSMAHFSRKHDIILFYRKRPGAYFNMHAVGIPRTKNRSNHMRRGVDEAGRAYRSIVSQGKEYRYYDDDPVFPGDVWDDVSHLQQKDPQRTGYDSQKPLRLMERILLCSSRPGDLVCDLFSGSGTTAFAAAMHGRRFLALDESSNAISVARKRLLGHSMRIEAPSGAGRPSMAGDHTMGLGLADVRFHAYQLEAGLCALELPGMEAVDQISVGYMRGDTFHAYDSVGRTRQNPALPKSLELPVLDGQPAVLTVDVLGRRLVHILEGLDDGEQI